MNIDRTQLFTFSRLSACMDGDDLAELITLRHSLQDKNAGLVLQVCKSIKWASLPSCCQRTEVLQPIFPSLLKRHAGSLCIKELPLCLIKVFSVGLMEGDKAALTPPPFSSDRFSYRYSGFFNTSESYMLCIHTYISKAWCSCVGKHWPLGLHLHSHVKPFPLRRIKRLPEVWPVA